MAEKENQVAVEAAVVIESKAPLPEGFRAMADELGGGRTAKRLQTAAWFMDRGLPVGDALTKSRLPAAIRELLNAAVDSGRPADVMQELVELDRTRRDLRRRILVILAYPAFILFAMACVLLFLGMFLAPAFAAMFNDFEIDLPGLTVAVLFLSTKGFPLFFLVTCVILAAGAAVWMIPGSALLERMTYLFPLIGGPRRYSRLMRFARLSALLIEQKEPLPDALRWAGQASGSPLLRRMARHLAKGVEKGEPLDAAMARQRAIPPTMIPNITWGLENNRLGESFRAAESAFSGRVATQAEYLAVLILPMTLLIVAAVLPMFIIALFLPMITIIQSLT